jgi:hypothetical protein
MSTITNGKYADFTADLKTLIERAVHVKVSVASDNSGANLANDSNGNPISKRLIVTMNYTYPHTTPTGENVLGNYLIKFDDGATFSVADGVTNYWYILEGIEPYVYKNFV